MKTFSPLLLIAVVAACADGGANDRTPSQVKVTDPHHLFSFRTLRGFGALPFTGTTVFTERATLNFFNDSSYTVTRSNSTTSPDGYAIATNGEMTLYVTDSFSSGSVTGVAFRGGYGQVLPTTGDYFFTDRVSSQSSPSIGLFYGCKVLSGQVELAGDWHLFSLHAILGETIASVENVGRSAFGKVAIDGSGAGTPRNITTLSGQQSTGSTATAAVTFSGTIQNLLDGNNVGNGTCTLTVGYTPSGALAPDNRPMQCVATDTMVYALDSDQTDGEAGMLTMVRAFPAQTAANVALAAGTFLVGGHTLFVNPANAGADTFVGTLTLTAAGGFLLDALDAQGNDFAYSGTWSLAADGGITIAIPGTNETWRAAIDTDYDTLVVVDPVVENRSNNTPELNFLIGTRRKDS